MMEKRSVSIAGHRTSVSLEREFWLELQKIARDENMSVGRLVSSVDARGGPGNLSSRLRLFVLARLSGRPLP